MTVKLARASSSPSTSIPDNVGTGGIETWIQVGGEQQVLVVVEGRVLGAGLLEFALDVDRLAGEVLGAHAEGVAVALVRLEAPDKEAGGHAKVVLEGEALTGREAVQAASEDEDPVALDLGGIGEREEFALHTRLTSMPVTSVRLAYGDRTDNVKIA